MFKLLLFLVFLSGHYIVAAQTITVKARIIDTLSSRPVAFATVGIKGKAIGTVADENGEAELRYERSAVADSSRFIISCIGYSDKIIPVREFVRRKVIVKMLPVSRALAPVPVSPKRMKLKTFGHTGKSKFFSVPFYTRNEETDDNLGREIGQAIKVDKDCRLKTFNFHSHGNDFKSVTCRLNIYQIKDGIPAGSLLTKDIIFKVTRQDPGWIQLDLSKYNIYFDKKQEVIVAMQWLRNEKLTEKSKWFNISASISPLHSAMRRDKSQDAWTQIKGANISLYFTGEIYK